MCADLSQNDATNENKFNINGGDFDEVLNLLKINYENKI